MSKGKLFIAATNQHVGKTTATLGLIDALIKRGYEVGYCKPCGEKFLEVFGGKVDKDTVLFADMMKFEIDPAIHSPIITGGGAVNRYIDNPEPERATTILRNAVKVLEERHPVVIYEGTGHPGVGSVIDYSNAQVAKLIDTGVILVVEGGIGSTIDRLMLSKHFFEHVGVKVHGVIINKILEHKMEKVQKYLSKRLTQMGVEIFGYIPFAKELAYPQMATVHKTLKGDLLYGQTALSNLVQDYLAGSLTEKPDLDNAVQYLLVVSSQRLPAALERLQSFWQQQGAEPHLAGVVLTGNENIAPQHADFLQRYNIPTIRIHYDTYEAITKLSKIEVKINTQTPDKVKRAIELFGKHVDIDRILEVMGLSKNEN